MAAAPLRRDRHEIRELILRKRHSLSSRQDVTPTVLAPISNADVIADARAILQPTNPGLTAARDLAVAHLRRRLLLRQVADSMMGAARLVGAWLRAREANARELPKPNKPDLYGSH